MSEPAHEHRDDSGHAHGVSESSDGRWLLVALLINVAFMVVEVVVRPHCQLARAALRCRAHAHRCGRDWPGDSGSAPCATPAEGRVHVRAQAQRDPQRPDQRRAADRARRHHRHRVDLSHREPARCGWRVRPLHRTARRCGQRRGGVGAGQGQPREPERAGRVPAQPLGHALVDRRGGRRPGHRADRLGPGRWDRGARGLGADALRRLGADPRLRAHPSRRRSERP